MPSFVDAVIFIASSPGTGDFVVSVEKPGWRTPAAAGAVNGATYRYRAFSDSQLEWEIGTTVYDSGADSFTRANILDSSNAGAAVNFTSPPNVGLTAFATDFPSDAELAKIGFLVVTGAINLDNVAAAIASYGTAATKNTGTAAGNVPILDGSGLLDTAVLPALAISDVFVVASQAAMLALTAQRGDVAVRSDINKSFILSTNSPGTLADWKELLTPTDAVLSVAGKTGVVTLQVADLTDMSANARSFNQAANYAAMRTALGVAIGSDVQAYSALLAQYAGLAAPGADRLVFWDHSALSPAYLTLGTGLSITGTTINASAQVASPERFPKLSNNTTDATNDIDFTAAILYDTTLAQRASIGALTKRLDANWGAGNNQGMRYSGAAITNTTYQIYACFKAAGADPDYYADPSTNEATVLSHLQAETGGASYAYLQYVGSIMRIGGAIRAFKQNGKNFQLDVMALDLSTTSVGTTSSLRTLTVPTGRKHEAIYETGFLEISADVFMHILDPDQTDTAVSGGTSYDFRNWSAATGAIGLEQRRFTNTNAQVRTNAHVASVSTSFWINTKGWVDHTLRG